MTTNLEIARTIQTQLGGSMFCMMTGAKGFLAIDSGLAFRVGRNGCGVNLVRVILLPNDTYRMEFCRLRACKVTILSVADGIYCDMLQEVFTNNTGLYTSMGRRAA